MYTRACTTTVRENILKSFTTPSTPLRLVIATSSFGMGIDCSDIRHVIHLSAPADIETYVQETGEMGYSHKQFCIFLLGNMLTNNYGTNTSVAFYY